MLANRTDTQTVLYITTAGSFLTPFISSAVVIALPAIGQALKLNAIMLNWIASAFLLAAAIFVVPLGRLADIIGRKRVYLAGVTIFTLFSLLCVFAKSAAMLIFLRVMQGIGAAAVFGTSVAILAAASPPGERGKVLGINSAVVYIGLSLGPVLGGFLTSHYGWHSIFLVVVPIGIVIVALTLWKVKQEWIGADGEGFDWAGSIIYGIGLFGIIYGLSSVKLGPLALFIILGGAAALIVFAIVEKRARQPVLDIGMFYESRVLLFSSLAALINYSAIYAVSYLLSLYLQFTKGFSPQHAGLILIIQPIVQAILSPLAGKLSDKIETQKVASWGMGITAIGMLLFVFLNSETTIAYILLGLVLMGFGFALFIAPNTNAIMSSVKSRYFGVTSGILGTMRLVGQTLSMGIAAFVFSIYMGKVQVSGPFNLNLLMSIKTIFIIFTMLCFAGIFASLARGRIKLH